MNIANLFGWVAIVAMAALGLSWLTCRSTLFFHWLQLAERMQARNVVVWDELVAIGAPKPGSILRWTVNDGPDQVSMPYYLKVGDGKVDADGEIIWLPEGMPETETFQPGTIQMYLRARRRAFFGAKFGELLTCAKCQSCHFAWMGSVGSPIPWAAKPLVALAAIFLTVVANARWNQIVGTPAPTLAA